jgi:hypothetical protein
MVLGRADVVTHRRVNLIRRRVMCTIASTAIVDHHDEHVEPMSRRVFVVTVTGEMGPALRAEFDDVDVAVEHGVSRVLVVCPDPSVLHGVLRRLDALDLELIDVRPIDEMPTR